MLLIKTEIQCRQKYFWTFLIQDNLKRALLWLHTSNYLSHLNFGGGAGLGNLYHCFNKVNVGFSACHEKTKLVSVEYLSI